MNRLEPYCCRGLHRDAYGSRCRKRGFFEWGGEREGGGVKGREEEGNRKRREWRGEDRGGRKGEKRDAREGIKNPDPRILYREMKKLMKYG